MFERKLENPVDESEPQIGFGREKPKIHPFSREICEFNEKRNIVSQHQRTKKQRLGFSLSTMIGGLPVHFVLRFVLAIDHDLCWIPLHCPLSTTFGGCSVCSFTDSSICYSCFSFIGLENFRAFVPMCLDCWATISCLCVCCGV